MLEEGLPLSDLEIVVASMRIAACAAGVSIVTGDTKVVERGKGDGMFITTSGVGLVEREEMGPRRVRPGDAVIVSGDLGAHGIAILSMRDGLEFDAAVASDTAPLWTPVTAMLSAGIDVHCLRGLTCGGLASALNDIAVAADVGIVVNETAMETVPGVRAACELLALDPLYVASEGRFVAFVAPEDADRTIKTLRHVRVSRHAAIVGRVEKAGAGVVTLRSRIGGARVLDLHSGEELPRIC